MSKTTVLHVGGLHWATSEHAIESTLSRREGVESVEANAANQSATVTYDPDVTSVAELAGWVRECGYHCAGRSVPMHVCEPIEEGYVHDATVTHERHADHGIHVEAGDHAGHSPALAATAPAEHSAHEMMGHGGHGGMSMDDMVRDMRNRFVVAAVLTVGIALWSPMGRDMLGFSVPAPFGLSDDVFALLLSLPVVFYSAWIFCRRRLPGAAQPHPGHDGPRRGRGRGGVAVQRRRHADRRRRGVLRGRGDAHGIRAAGPLVRDARARWRERGRASAHGPRAAHGHRPARWCSRSRSPLRRSWSATCS